LEYKQKALSRLFDIEHTFENDGRIAIFNARHLSDDCAG